MTPRRLDPSVVQRKLSLIDELLRDLDHVRPAGAEDLRADRVRRRAVERILTQLVQLAVDVNAHLASALGDAAPEDYRASFDTVAALHVLPEELARRLQPSVGLRTLLIHEYANIDLALVASACDQAAADYRAYVEAVASLLQQRRA